MHEGSDATWTKTQQQGQNWDAANGNGRPRDTQPYSNYQKVPFAVTKRPDSAGNAGPGTFSGPQGNQSRVWGGPTQDENARRRPTEPNSLVDATDTEKSATGRKPAVAKLQSAPSSAQQPAIWTFEPAHPRGKTRLNLLNPMALLARRRTSQAIPHLSPESLTSNLGGTDNFDFIRKGTRVHDFSTPRPRRNVSYDNVRTTENATLRQYPRSPNVDDENPRSGGSHTPVFTENFEEEQYPAAGPHVRKANDITDLPLPQPPYAKGIPKPLDQNLTTKGNEAIQNQPHTRKVSDSSSRKPVYDVGPPVPPKVEGEVPPPRRISINVSSTPPKAHPSSSKRRSRNVSEVSAKDMAALGLPKHMKSTSSRFSFDMIGAAEQERLLEDRHRQKALEKKNNPDEVSAFDEEDDYDYDNMDDDDDGLEERIPGVNADLEEGEEDEEYEIEETNGMIEGNVSGFSFQQSKTSPLSPYTPGTATTPRDDNGEVIGFAMTKNSPYIPSFIARQSQDSSLTPVSPDSNIGSRLEQGMQGLGLQNVNMGYNEAVEEEHAHANPPAHEFPQPAAVDDDDFYFDSGIIDTAEDGGDAIDFDESIFDKVDTDEFGRPLKNVSSLPTLYPPPSLTSGPSPKNIQKEDIQVDQTEIRDSISELSPMSPSNGFPPGGLAPKPSFTESKSMPQISQGLTQDTLAAYQSALAAAAHQAHASGKFRRDSVQSSQPEELQPDLNPSSTSAYEPFSPSYEDDFDYDDLLEDDAIIAAANAEALANDQDGFYGQEFGFYSAPAASSAQYANGGYFGPRGAVDGVCRSQSGRVISREPNLTPITERSEYSNRNSFMSVHFQGERGIGSSIGSPGLAQLMNERDYETTGDMSLSALLKLRRGAWGGSQASLHSSQGGSPRSGGAGDDMSPVGPVPPSLLPPWAREQTQSPNQPPPMHRRQNSNFSLVSEEDEDEHHLKEGGKGKGTTGKELDTLAPPVLASPFSPSISPLAQHPVHPHPTSTQPQAQAQIQLQKSKFMEPLQPPPAPSSTTPKASISEQISPPPPPTSITSIIANAPSSDPKSTDEISLDEIQIEKDKEKKQHKYTSSTESISYIREKEDQGTGEGGRWVLERRRTDEEGRVSVLDREVVGGRI